MGPLALFGAVAAYVALKKPESVGQAPDGRQMAEIAKATLKQTMKSPIWGKRSKLILGDVYRMIPSDLIKESPSGPRSRYNLLKKLSEDERGAFIAAEYDKVRSARMPTGNEDLSVWELQVRAESAEHLAAANALMAYISFGGKEREAIAFLQDKMGMEENSGTLDEETIEAIEEILEDEFGAEITDDIFGAPVMKEFGLTPQSVKADQVGWKVRLIRGTRPFIRQRHANSREIIGALCGCAMC